MDVEIKILNLPTVLKAIAKAPDIMNKSLTDGLRKAALLVERYSKQVTPVDTGRLRASIFTDIQPLIATIQPKTDYAIYVHEGTRYITGRPFMKQGVEMAKDEIERVVNDEVSQGLKKVK